MELVRVIVAVVCAGIVWAIAVALGLPWPVALIAALLGLLAGWRINVSRL